jgi:REP element-mobilizing transposase RayT
MARRRRLDAPGLVSHVTARGVDGCPIFRSAADRRAYLALLEDTVERSGWLVYAYCLMGNHVHLLVETTWPTLSRGLQRLNGIHAQRFNRRHARSGHLFQGRFGSEPVERDAHLLSTARYVVLNPVRAGLCRKPADWPWSSYRATAGAANAGFLALERLLPFFGADEDRARRRYCTYVREGIGAARQPRARGLEPEI